MQWDNSLERKAPGIKRYRALFVVENVCIREKRLPGERGGDMERKHRLPKKLPAAKTFAAGSQCKRAINRRTYCVPR